MASNRRVGRDDYTQHLKEGRLQEAKGELLHIAERFALDTAELEQQLAEARQDAERLDELERQAKNYKDGLLIVDEGNGLGLRAAIDAAIAARQKEGKNA